MQLLLQEIPGIALRQVRTPLLWLLTSRMHTIGCDFQYLRTRCNKEDVSSNMDTGDLNGQPSTWACCKVHHSHQHCSIYTRGTLPLGQSDCSGADFCRSHPCVHKGEVLICHPGPGLTQHHPIACGRLLQPCWV
jgi:hypothetical protein